MASRDSTPEPSSLTKSLVMMSLSGAMESTVPMVLSESSLPTLRQLEEHHLAANKPKKSGKLRLPDLLKPRTRMKSDSETDDSPTSPTRWRSPHIKRRKLRVRGDGKSTRSADNSPSRDKRPPNTLETTPVTSLPGQPAMVSASIDVPTILVSPDEQEDYRSLRKVSQSSRLSVGSSTMTSGKIV